MVRRPRHCPRPFSLAGFVEFEHEAQGENKYLFVFKSRYFVSAPLLSSLDIFN